MIILYQQRDSLPYMHKHYCCYFYYSFHVYMECFFYSLTREISHK